MSANPAFETNYEAIVARISAIDPIAYGKTRNYIDGAVTYLSPYISRGVISTKQVLNSVLERGYDLWEIESFVKELAWRDYFQRVWHAKDINQDLKKPQEKVSNYQIPESVLKAETGILGIDNALKTLYATGYMHNHCRMYVAFMVCNLGQSHWKNPAQWMYYHLLDGDWASNACSWQWVAGSNSSKKYIANQENISKYTKTQFQNSFLNVDYAELENMVTPAELSQTVYFQAKTKLPEPKPLDLDASLPTFVYNYYNLDPLWHAEEKGNRILLLEPSLFEQYPISSKCLNFMLALSRNIPDMQVFVGSFEALQAHTKTSRLYFKEHPLHAHYQGIAEARDWICEAVSGYFPSFFAYWKVIEKQLKKQY